MLFFVFFVYRIFGYFRFFSSFDIRFGFSCILDVFRGFSLEGRFGSRIWSF